MRRHNERLYRAARAILRDESEAEDVMQQAYVNAYSHLRQFDGRSKFSTWLTRIAVHEALARARRRGRYMTMDPVTTLTRSRSPQPSMPRPDPERLAILGELGALMESAIDRLPDGTREVFVLRQIEGHAHRRSRRGAQRQRSRRQDTLVARTWCAAPRPLRAGRSRGIGYVPLPAAEMRPRRAAVLTRISVARSSSSPRAFVTKQRASHSIESRAPVAASTQSSPPSKE